jgi:CRP-like cAMP-binding protein
MSTQPSAGNATTEILGRIHLFSELEPSLLERIAAGSRLLSRGRGETLFHKGDPAEGFFYVIQGRVKLTLVSPEGGEKVIEILREGTTFGEAVIFLGQAYPANAETMVESRLLFIPAAAVIEAVEAAPGFALKLLAGLSRRLHGLVRDVESYSLCSSTQRVIGYLLGEAGDSGRPEILLPAAKGVVASRLNLTPETLSRIFAELSRAGLIEVQGRRIVLHDLARLRHHS